jgi:hypothetical protein
VGWTCGWDKEARSIYIEFLGKDLGKCSLGKPGECVNKTEINIRHIDFDGIRWMELAEDCLSGSLLSAVLNISVIMLHHIIH